MLKRLRFIATLACLSISFTIFANEGLVFINDDLRTGLNRAASEGKLIFLEFSASYCTPCRIMDEYTFTNPAVIGRINSSYVPVKVDIQSFDGFDLKNQYKVTVLPTILILDSKGRPVARYEETMGASKLSSVLDKHNLPQHRNRIAPAAYTYNSTGPNNNVNKPMSTPTSVANARVTREPTAAVAAPVAVRAPTDYNNTPQRSKPTNAPAAPVAVRTPTDYNNAPQRSKPTNAVATTATPQVSQRQTEIPTTGFTIQAGAYAQLVGAQGAVNDIKAKVGGQKQFIMQSKINGKVTYRIFIGSFTTRQQAAAFIKKNAIVGYVRGFEEFNKK